MVIFDDFGVSRKSTIFDAFDVIKDFDVVAVFNACSIRLCCYKLLL
jgi:hypothetical protein